MAGSGQAVVIRGRRYKSARHAARRFGVTPATVQRAAREGRLDLVGLPGGRKPPRGPFTVRGEVFADAPSIAARFGVGLVRVYQAIRKGQLDRVGLGPGSGDRMPVRIRDLTFGNYAEAAARLGCSVGALRQRMFKGTIDRAGLTPVNPRNGSKPFRVGGLVFPSQAEACRALGLKAGYIAHWKRHRLAVSGERILAAAMAYRRRQEAAAAEAVPMVEMTQTTRAAGQPRAAEARAEGWTGDRAA